MTARARKLPDTPMLGGRPMADLSPRKFEERVRKHGQARYDHAEIQDKARGSVISFGFDFARCMLGFPPPTVKQ